MKTVSFLHEIGKSVYPNPMNETIEQAMTVTVRPWQLQDAYALKELCKDSMIKNQWDHAFPYPYTLERSKHCIEAFLHANPLHMQIYALCVKGELCGLLQCVATAYQSAILTYQIETAFQLESILREAIRQMCIICFSSMDVKTIYAKASLHDLRSRMALLENAFCESRETAPIYLYYLHRHSLSL